MEDLDILPAWQVGWRKRG